MAKSQASASNNDKLDDLRARLAKAKEAGPADLWKGEKEGDSFVGEFVGYHQTEIQGRVVDVADMINLETGKPTAILMSASVKGQFVSKNVQKGDMVGIIYHGQRKAGRGMTKLYAVEKA